MDLLGSRRIDPVRQSPRTRMYGYFTHGTDPPPRPCSSGFFSLPDPLRLPPSPTHSVADFSVAGFRLASGTMQQSDYWQSAASHFAFAYRVPSSGAAGDPASPPEVTRHSSVPCRPQSPCFWWVNENAFTSLWQARPCPTLGRPV